MGPVSIYNARGEGNYLHDNILTTVTDSRRISRGREQNSSTRGKAKLSTSPADIRSQTAMKVLRVNPLGDRELFQYATRHLSVRFVSVVERCVATRRGILYRQWGRERERERDGRKGAWTGQGDGRREPGRRRASENRCLSDARQAENLQVRSPSCSRAISKFFFLTILINYIIYIKLDIFSKWLLYSREREVIYFSFVI